MSFICRCELAKALAVVLVASATSCWCGSIHAGDAAFQSDSAPPGDAPATPADDAASPESSPASDETPPADPTTTPSDDEPGDAAAIERNELLAEIDARYAPRQSEAPIEEAPVASAYLPLTIGLSLGVGFVVLLAATFLVLKP